MTAATDPAPSRQGPPAYRPGDPVWNAGYETGKAQAAATVGDLLAYLTRPFLSSMPDYEQVEELQAAILAMRPKPPPMEGAP